MILLDTNILVHATTIISPHHAKAKVVAPSSALLESLPRLLRHARSKGAHVFDVLLVATMLEHGVQTIYTENIRDFSGFREIRAINPLSKSTPTQ